MLRVFTLKKLQKLSAAGWGDALFLLFLASWFNSNKVKLNVSELIFMHGKPRERNWGIKITGCSLYLLWVKICRLILLRVLKSKMNTVSKCHQCYLLGIKIHVSHDPQTRFSFLLRCFSKRSDKHPRDFYMGVSPGGSSLQINHFVKAGENVWCENRSNWFILVSIPARLKWKKKLVAAVKDAFCWTP